MNELQRLKFIELVQELAKDADGYVYWRYSGKCMYGEQCVGVVTKCATRVIERAAQRGLLGASFDQLGLSYVVYWPQLVALDGEGDDS